MKKSEMINLISDIIEHVIKEQFDSKIEAEYILQKMEENGMAPPLVKLNNFGVLDNAWENEDD